MTSTKFFKSPLFASLVIFGLFLGLLGLMFSSNPEGFVDNIVYIAIISAVFFALIFGLSGGLAIFTFNIDREVKYMEEGITIPDFEAQAKKRQEKEAARAEATPRPNVVTETLTEGGYVEAPATMGLDNTKLGLWIFIASEMMFFTALIGAYVLYLALGQLVVSPELNSFIAAGGTFVLIGSSFTAVMAFDKALEQKKQEFICYMLATLVLGIAFLSIQGYEWVELLSHGVTPTTDIFGTAFFVLTGFHGLHVLIGIIWLMFALLKAFRGDFDDKPLGVETFGIYWHFVDVVWILLFTIIYLL